MACDAGRKGEPIQRALVLEAMGQHFLTDSFASGHTSTPRTSISEYWNGKYPNFGQQFMNKIAHDVAVELGNDATGLADAIPVSLIEDKAKALILAKLGAKPLPKIGHAFDTQSLQRMWTYKGQPNTVIGSVATTDRWIAVLVVSKTSGGGPTVTVLRRSDGKAVWSHGSKRDHFLGYGAAGGDLVAYYDSKDTSLHAVHVPDGKTGAVYRFDSGLAIGTERVGIAPAVPENRH